MTTHQWLAKHQAQRKRLEDKASKQLRAGDNAGWHRALSQAHFVDDIIAQFLGLDYSGTARNS